MRPFRLAKGSHGDAAKSDPLLRARCAAGPWTQCVEGPGCPGRGHGADPPGRRARRRGPGPSESGWQSAVSLSNLDNAPACLDSEVVAREPSAVPGGDFTTARYPSLLFAHNFVRDESQARASGLKTPSAQLSTGMAPL